MTRSTRLVALAATLSTFVLPFACSDATELQGNPPGPLAGIGGFEPGDQLPGGANASSSGMGSGNGSGSSSSGASSSSSTSSSTGGPPMCDDSLKRCAHLFTFADTGQKSVEIRGDFASDGWTAGVPLTKAGSTWSASVEVPYGAPVQYKFVLDGTTWVTDPANPVTVSDGQGGMNSQFAGTTCVDYTCATPTLGTFDWRDAVLYFVFIDRFSDGDPSNNGVATPTVEKPADYQGGDYAGLLAKINAGYFNDLGVNTLWLTVPVNNTTQAGIGTDGHEYSAYHGYWPFDLNATEEHFGTMADLKGVVDAAHTKKLKVILDYAMNHVHASAPIYTQHMNDGWFWPHDYNGQSCVCGNDAAGCGWDSPNAKRCWFTDYLPDWNYTNAAARKYSVDNVIWWAQQTGIDGLRLDAVKHVEDAWITDLRTRVTSDIEAVSKEHFYMVGETYTGDQSLIKYYVNPSKMLDGQFDFPFRANLVHTVLAREGSMADLAGFLAQNDGYYPGGIMSTFIGNHDVPRSIHFAEDSPWFGGNEWSDGKANAWSGQPTLPASKSPFERFANAYTVLLTSPGIPLIYYGDEIGMPGAGDPDNRRMMQWSGYSANQSFLLAHVKKLTAARAAHAALRRGTRAQLSVTNDTYVYKMSSGADVVYVALNRGDAPQTVTGLPGTALSDLIGGGMVTGTSTSLAARSSMVLVAP